MSDSISALARHLRGFDADATVAKALRREIERGVPAVRALIKANALVVLPSSGGLNAWVAAGRITSRVVLSGRTVRVTLRMGRSNITGKASDFRAIDRGRVRHPSWGRRFAGQWHYQGVPPDFFTAPARDAGQWATSIDTAIDTALAALR